METPARLAIEISDHHLADGTVEQRRNLARAILNAIGICEKEVAGEIVKANADGILGAARIKVAVTAFGKALCLDDGPSLAVQRHNPSWEAWKTLCDVCAGHSSCTQEKT